MTVASLVTGSGMCKAGTRTGRTQEGPRKDPVPVSLVLSHWCVLHHEVGPAALVVPQAQDLLDGRVEAGQHTPLVEVQDPEHGRPII